VIPVSPEQFTAAVTERLSLDIPREPQDLFRGLGYPRQDAGDHTINEGKPARPAAVLIPVVARATEAGHDPDAALRRPARPRRPGGLSRRQGGCRATPIRPLDGALREAEEEIGLSRRHWCTPLGLHAALPTSRTSGYRVVPVVGAGRSGVPVLAHQSTRRWPTPSRCRFPS
jgi:8-oxo-dGTP pyrophosphatase MutT (NUDIX family)